MNETAAENDVLWCIDCHREAKDLCCERHRLTIRARVTPPDATRP
jgi:hypothetical protein